MAKIKNKDKKRAIRKEVLLPKGVTAAYNDKELVIKGPKGEVKMVIKSHNISINVEGDKIIFGSDRASKENKKVMGSLVAHTNNMVKGSMENHTYILKICSGHFPMNVSVSDNKMIIKNFLGEKVPRILKLKDGAVVKIEGSMINVTSPSKEIAGQVSADIEQLTRRPGYDTRVFQDGIYITNKAGKELK